jgi:amidase
LAIYVDTLSYLFVRSFTLLLLCFTGSGAAVAANFAVFALGSDTAGSIRGPSSSTSLVGIKPTKGLVSLDGVVPYSYFVDVVGPMARTVTDAAIALTVMADSMDDAVDYTSGLKVGSLVGKRLARIAGWSGGNGDVDALFDASIADMESLGATVLEVNVTEYISDMEIVQGIVSGWSVLGPITDFGCKDINTYLESAGGGCPDNLTAIVDILDTYADTPFNAMNPPRLDGLKSCVASDETTDDDEYIRLTQEVVPAMQQALLDIMETLELDAFIYPSMLCPSRVTWYVDDPTWECDSNTDQWVVDYLANIVGWPDVSVPMGYVEAGNAPASISFLGPEMSEATLLAMAYDFEQETMHRVAPPGFDALTGETVSYQESFGDATTVVERSEDELP